MAKNPQLGLSFGDTIVCGQVERWARAAGFSRIIGLDEAGRGPLAGPVVAAACVLPDPCPIAGLDDSKKLSEARRESLFAQIEAHALALSVVFVEPDVIDRLNILHASLYGMSVAWQQVTQANPALSNALVLVDGNQRAPLPARVDQRPIIKGDGRSLNIAAASILAKVSRDRLMVLYHDRWPAYGFAQHKGYPTPQHRQAIASHGPCPIHRKSFRMPEPAS